MDGPEQQLRCPMCESICSCPEIRAAAQTFAVHPISDLPSAISESGMRRAGPRSARARGETPAVHQPAAGSDLLPRRHGVTCALCAQVTRRRIFHPMRRHSMQQQTRTRCSKARRGRTKSRPFPLAILQLPQKIRFRRSSKSGTRSQCGHAIGRFVRAQEQRMTLRPRSRFQRIL